MEEFDVLEFSNLSKDRKDCIRLTLDLLRGETLDHDARQATIKNIFQMITARDIPELMTSVKDFGRLGTGIYDAEAGLHVIRTYIAHLMAERRRRRNGYGHEAGYVYDRFGIVELGGFLPSLMVGRVLKEMEPLPLATSKDQTTLINAMPKCTLNDILTFGMNNLTTGLWTCVMDCLGMGLYNKEANNLYLNNTFVQKLHNRRDDGDVQKVLHQDTFFPCLKFWYFPKEVTLDTGPLTYVVKSHKLTKARAQYIYEESVRIARGDAQEYTKDHYEGSIRITQEKLAEMGLKEKGFACPANTLVIANVFGFHRRGDVETEGFRDSIHGSIRVSTPFI